MPSGATAAAPPPLAPATDAGPPPRAHRVEVAFKGNRREFYRYEGPEPPPLRTPVIVEADRGEDLGRVHSTGEAAEVRNAGLAHGTGRELPSFRVLRLATSAEVARERQARLDDDDARRRAAERVRANHLVMKLSDAEWQWDRKKLTLYFTAEKRVDFRTLVRDLAAMFRARIELKQIGVRDEARRLGGVGRCGREYCSASWLPELRPVNLGVAKDQRLSLNPTQISGACGRLMCCLRYEHEFYVQARKRFPKEGKVLTTARGEERVIANDIFRERVTLRNTEGESRIVPLAELDAERAAGELRGMTEELAVPEVAASRDDDFVPDPDAPLAGDSPAAAPDAAPTTARPAAAGDGRGGATAPGEGAAAELRRKRRRGRRGGRRGRGSAGAGDGAPGADGEAAHGDIGDAPGDASSGGAPPDDANR
ncbi:MAG: hypothetical protein HYX65_11300 [Gemmatimonadetes bacterium]|nr:hypothetical protein [Gemmatimonadota bacterium]